MSDLGHCPEHSLSFFPYKLQGDVPQSCIMKSYLLDVLSWVLHYIRVGISMYRCIFLLYQCFTKAAEKVKGIRF